MRALLASVASFKKSMESDNAELQKEVAELRKELEAYKSGSGTAGKAKGAHSDSEEGKKQPFRHHTTRTHTLQREGCKERGDVTR